MHGRPFQKGNMYIHFTVVFPDRIDPALVPAVQKALPAQQVDNNVMDTDDHEEVASMHTVEDIEQELKSRAHMAKGHSSAAYDSDDDDDMPRGQRVQCAHQ